MRKKKKNNITAWISCFSDLTFGALYIMVRKYASSRKGALDTIRHGCSISSLVDLEYNVMNR